MQEFVIGAHTDRTSANNPYDIGGFGAVAGAAMGGGGWGAFGVTAALASSNVTDAELKGSGQQAVSSFEAGAYWQATKQRATFDLRGALGAVAINGTRQVFAYDPITGNVAINRTVKENRSAYTATAHGGASYLFDGPFGLFVQPRAKFDYFYMAEDGFRDNDTIATSVGFPSAFALAVKSRSGSEFTSQATVAVGGSWGQDFRVRPEIELGLTQSAGDPGKTTAQFVSGGPSFTLSPNPMNGVGGVARLSLKASTNFYEVAVQAGTEMHDRYYSGDARVTIRLMF
jgi:outer membrane autotransporter protein